MKAKQFLVFFVLAVCLPRLPPLLTVEMSLMQTYCLLSPCTFLLCTDKQIYGKQASNMQKYVCVCVCVGVYVRTRAVTQVEAVFVLIKMK